MHELCFTLTAQFWQFLLQSQSSCGKGMGGCEPYYVNACCERIHCKYPFENRLTVCFKFSTQVRAQIMGTGRMEKRTLLVQIERVWNSTLPMLKLLPLKE